MSQVAIGQRERLQVFGGDWSSTDCSSARDYIHVIDLAEWLLAALNSLLASGDQLLQLNLRSGRGHSVLELVETFSRACGQFILYVITVADLSEAKRQLGWPTRPSLHEMASRRFDLAAGQWKRVSPRWNSLTVLS